MSEKNKDFVIKTITLNGHKVKVRSPTKTISLEEAAKIHRKILRESLGK